MSRNDERVVSSQNRCKSGSSFALTSPNIADRKAKRRKKKTESAPAHLGVVPVVVAHVAYRVHADERADDADDEKHDHRQPVDSEEPRGIGSRQPVRQLEPDRQAHLGECEHERVDPQVAHGQDGEEHADGQLAGEDHRPHVERDREPEEARRPVAEPHGSGDRARHHHQRRHHDDNTSCPTAKNEQ